MLSRARLHHIWRKKIGRSPRCGLQPFDLFGIWCSKIHCMWPRQSVEWIKVQTGSHLIWTPTKTPRGAQPAASFFFAPVTKTMQAES